MKFNDGYWLLRDGVTARYASEALDVRTDRNSASIAVLSLCSGESPRVTAARISKMVSAQIAASSPAMVNSSARISSTGSPSSPSTCRRCASGARTFPG